MWFVTIKKARAALSHSVFTGISAITWTGSSPNWPNRPRQPGKDGCTADAAAATVTAGPAPDIPKP
jgi:hypothetical protein